MANLTELVRAHKAVQAAKDKKKKKKKKKKKVRERGRTIAGDGKLSFFCCSHTLL